MRSLRATRLAGLALVAAATLAPSHTRAAVLFSDNFAYPTGNLAGNNGGSGWSGGWSGGNNTVVTGTSGISGHMVRLSKDASVASRALGTAYTTGGATAYYLSFLLNANPVPPAETGEYAGVAILSGNASLFAGVPGSSGKFGFDWANVGGGEFAAANNTNYLMLLEIKAGSAAGQTVVNLYATTNLSTTGAALAGGTALGSIEDMNFTFNGVELAGGYDGNSITLAGLAMATTANEAVSLSQAVVPEPSTMGWAAAGILVAAGAWRRRERKSRG